MKYTDKIRRLAWSLEFAAKYMEITGCRASQAFTLAERTARECWQRLPAEKAAEGIALKHSQPSASEPREHPPANA